jgi:hypothetical protein
MRTKTLHLERIEREYDLACLTNKEVWRAE